MDIRCFGVGVGVLRVARRDLKRQMNPAVTSSHPRIPAGVRKFGIGRDGMDMRCLGSGCGVRRC
jgi:hypothetical protein